MQQGEREMKTYPMPERFIGDTKVSRFAVDFEVANNADIVRNEEGLLASTGIRRLRLRGLVDSGATGLVLPKRVVEQLGLRERRKVKVRYADGRRAVRAEVENVYVELLGRHGVYHAVVEPKRQTALIGAIILEDLDLLADCKNQVLLPRDPRYKTYEIE
jgi:clan AA aspartic protease